MFTDSQRLTMKLSSSINRTRAVSASVAQNIEPYTHALSCISIIFIPDKEPKYRTVQLNTGYLATSKTEFLLICLRDPLKKIPDPSLSLNLDSASTHTFTQTSPVRNLGVIFDQ